jgi:hypothetical protein
MNNETKFAAPAHNLLLKKDPREKTAFSIKI